MSFPDWEANDIVAQIWSATASVRNAGVATSPESLEDRTLVVEFLKRAEELVREEAGKVRPT